MPSKLFVGNLPENVDSNKLKQIFQPFCKVTECDIVKNYAFVHVEEEDVDSIIARLSGYTIEGKVVTIKKSTSKLRPTPGMPNRCFRCQSDEHRTPQCPLDPGNNGKSDGLQTIKIDLTSSGSLKRSGDPMNDPSKRLAYAAPSAVEAEIPQPLDTDLQQLYQEYQLSRQRYVYYRDRLLKEMEAKHHGSTAGYVLSTAHPPTAVVPSGGTQLSAAPVSYQTPPPLAQPVPVSAPYNSTTQLRAPYAIPPAAPYANAVPQLQQAAIPAPVPPYGHSVAPPVQPNMMTTQQYLQQIQKSAPTQRSGNGMKWT